MHFGRTQFNLLQSEREGGCSREQRTHSPTLPLVISNVFFKSKDKPTWVVYRIMGTLRQYSVLFHKKNKYFGITNGELEGKKRKVKVTQSYLTLCNQRGYRVHRILRPEFSRILEWVAIPFSRGSSQLRDWTQVSRMAGWFFTSWATRVHH